MMTLGIITSPDAAGIEWVAKYGLHAAEFCYNHNGDPAHENYPSDLMKRVPEILAACAKNDVKVLSVGRWGDPKVNPDGTLIEDAIKKNYEMIDVCAALGCPVYNTGVNYARNKSFEENCEIAINILKGFVDYGRERGVKIAVYNCDWDNFIVDPKTWASVLVKVPGLGIKYDPSHCLNEGSEDYLGEMKDWTEYFYHFHVKGTLQINRRHVDDPPAGLDMINWRAVMGLLYRYHYNGMLSIEPHSHTWYDGELGDWGIRFTIDYIDPMIFKGKEGGEAVPHP